MTTHERAPKAARQADDAKASAIAATPPLAAAIARRERPDEATSSRPRPASSKAVRLLAPTLVPMTVEDYQAAVDAVAALVSMLSRPARVLEGDREGQVCWWQQWPAPGRSRNDRIAP